MGGVGLRSLRVSGLFRTEEAPGVAVGVRAGRGSRAGSWGPHSGVGMPIWGSDPVLDALERPSLPAGGRGKRECNDRQPRPPATGEGGGAGGSAPWVLMGGHNAD